MSVIFLFIDGLGLGASGYENPFWRGNYTAFNHLCGGQPFIKKSSQFIKEEHCFKAIDATLGIEGFPQSGTGQTSLFCGVNAAKHLGRHFGPFPHSMIRPFLENKSIVKELSEKGKKSDFINAYPPVFFEKSALKNRWSCTTYMMRSIGFELHSTEDVLAGKAVTADINQKAWKNVLNIDVPEIDEKSAAKRVVNSSQKNDLVLFEYYLTDKAGHTKDIAKAHEAIERLDWFISEIISAKAESDTLIISSDHGNVENMGIKTHTQNPVPLWILGPHAKTAREAASIMDVKQVILDIISLG